MATIDVVNLQNQKSGSVGLSASVFESEVKPHLYHAEVRRQLSARRAGTQHAISDTSSTARTSSETPSRSISSRIASTRAPFPGCDRGPPP